MKVKCILLQPKFYSIKSWKELYCLLKQYQEHTFIDLFLLLKANYKKLPIIFANIRV